VSDDLYTGPTVLAPGVSERGDRVARRIVWPLLGLFLGVIALFYVAFGVIVVNGESMEPTLNHADRVLITKSYDTARRGDVVVFDAGGEKGLDEDLIKRVVAVEGDSVSVEAGVATVNGVIEETASLTLGPDDRAAVPLTVVEPGTVFVLGDNRPISLDSRDLGSVPASAISGRAVFVVAPVYRMRVLD
jgi:signal peptidase I